ncbi:glycosyltransferase [Marinobacter sp.]|uniref:glycosyltransferase n=1 Tax=Marinobacter sp. TaxID=50741 RepID=UPI003A913588
MPKDLVSIVVPCFNHEKYVQECIKSIISQDHENIELIVIDDGSTDGSVRKIEELVSKCKERFFRFEFRSRGNKGLCGTLNEAISWCKGEYYATIASDDLMLPHKISTQVGYFLRNPECDAVFGSANIIDKNGNIVGKRRAAKRTVVFEDLFLMRYSLCAPTQLIRTSSIRGAGNYPVGCYIEDWYMWLRLTYLHARIHVIPDTLVNYRRHEDNASSKLELMSENRTKIVEDYRKHNLYEFARAAVYLSAAIDVQPINKFSSLKFFRMALSKNRLVLFEKRTFYYFLKMFIMRSR